LGNQRHGRHQFADIAGSPRPQPPTPWSSRPANSDSNGFAGAAATHHRHYLTRPHAQITQSAPVGTPIRHHCDSCWAGGGAAQCGPPRDGQDHAADPPVAARRIDSGAQPPTGPARRQAEPGRTVPCCGVRVSATGCRGGPAGPGRHTAPCPSRCSGHHDRHPRSWTSRRTEAKTLPPPGDPRCGPAEHEDLGCAVTDLTRRADVGHRSDSAAPRVPRYPTDPGSHAAARRPEEWPFRLCGYASSSSTTSVTNPA
jgi:hypothetical protein